MKQTLVLRAVDLTKVYHRGSEEVRALNGVTFEVGAGEFVAVTGPSGAGKTTLLSIVGGMDTPTSGTLEISGRQVQGLREHERTRLRREQLGFVFQHFGLMPTLTVAENIALPALFAGRNRSVRVSELLERVGLSHRRTHRPHELSGGEMQRVAIARALVNEPALLLADEPTGHLDTATGQSIISLFKELNASGLTLMVVTHNSSMAAAAKRRLSLQDGTMIPIP
jgi:putative ABC transport system ATP-binding protein